MGKVHGSLARAGKVKNQTPKVAKADKKKKDIVKLLGCFRPDADSKKILEMWFTNMGFNIDSGNKDGKPSTSDEEDVQKMLRKLMRGDKTGKGPRRNLSDKQVQDALKEAGVDEVIVWCVNDGAVMSAWADDQDAGQVPPLAGDGDQARPHRHGRDSARDSDRGRDPLAGLPLVCGGY